MPEKKYQIFLSSTYADLKDERLAVSKAILDLGHIPAGMEMFPAADAEQLDYIKLVIDECDYYVLIIGARYGTIDTNGVSFTEREFDYATQAGKTVLVFVHANIEAVPRGKTDKDEEKYQKLMSFKDRASGGRLVKFWNTPEELTGQAIIALNRAFKTDPQVGWVRADQVPSHSTLADVLRYREEIDLLTAELATLRSGVKPVFDDAADLDEQVVVEYQSNIAGRLYALRQQMSFADFLKLVAPAIHTPSGLHGAKQAIKKGLQDRYAAGGLITAKSSSVQDALLHLVATGHVKMSAGSATEGTIYQLTEIGTKLWQELSYAKRT